ncbi:MAG: DUF3426 domain-containing protein [Desulfovibrio sp.]|uniref:DUF3426 domain-containing protein n=1 Tax=Desulfovibrio sp. 7SRBS1 TaxID=3378064 RepID=UPI003B3EB86A
MIVTCPECATKYNLPDDKISPSGARVRCTKCKHVFSVSPSVPSGDEALDDLLGANGQEEEDIASEQESERDTEDSGSGLDSFGDMDMGFDIGGKSKKKKAKGKGKGKKIFLSLLILLLLLGGGGFALVHFKVVSMDMIPFLGSAENATQTAEGEEGTKSPEDAVRLILLENVRQYYVNNEKAGSLFVIEGKAVNNFDTPREFLKVQATLFNADGVSLASKEVVCGNVLSYFQLQILSRTELEANLSNEMGVLNNNTNLDKGAGSPFMILFFDPPKDVAEFGVKVVEAKLPPKM